MAKMRQRLSGPQQESFNRILSIVEPPPAGEPAITYIDRPIGAKERKRNREADSEVPPSAAP